LPVPNVIEIRSEISGTKQVDEQIDMTSPDYILYTVCKNYTKIVYSQS